DKWSVASLIQLQASSSYPGTLIGFQLSDEPETVSCTQYPMSAIPTQIANFEAFTSAYPFLLNSTNYIYQSGICSPSTLNTNYMAAVPIGSFDDYPMINPYHTSYAQGLGTTTPVDQLWRQGWSVNQMMAERTAGAPFWVWVDTGTDADGFSTQNGFSCTSSTDVCNNGTVA